MKRVLPTFTVLKIKTPQKRRHHRFFGEFFIFWYVDMNSFFFLSSQGQEYLFLQMTSYIFFPVLQRKEVKIRQSWIGKVPVSGSPARCPGPRRREAIPAFCGGIFQSETGSLAFPYDKMKYQRIGGEEDGTEMAGLGETASGHRPGGIGVFDGCL
ncbi:MAG: hypothetical protein C0P66_008895 [Bacillaceae bacterium]